MCPDIDDLDEEIRGHLAISIKERIERGEDPAAARLAALMARRNWTTSAPTTALRLRLSMVLLLARHATPLVLVFCKGG